ncbi:pilus assembly protein TadG-related protein [Profundibacter sp.]
MKTRLQSSIGDRKAPFGSKPHGRAAAFLKPFKKFQKDEEGSIIIFSLFMFAMMLMIGGLAVDVMRAEYQRTEIQYTADRCALSASGLSQQLPAVQVVNDCFQKAGLGWLNPTVIVDQTQNSKRVSIQLPDPKIKTIFLAVDWSKVFKVGGGGAVEYLATPAAAAAVDGVQKVEISLVLDVSGSMDWNSTSGRKKVEDLKIAAKEFVDALMLTRPHNDTYSISIIPYATQVTAGPDLLSQFTVTSEHNYSNCVDFDATDYNSTTLSTTALLQRTGYFEVFTKNHGDKIRWDYRSCPEHNTRQILPLSGDIATLKSFIDNLTPGGMTSTEIGIKWGAALLDPSTRPAIQGLVDNGKVSPLFAGLPVNYGQDGVLKVIVAMTDGENTSSYELKPEYASGMTNVWYYKAGPNDHRYWVYNAGRGKYRRLYFDDNTNLKSSKWVSSPASSSKRLSMPELWKQATQTFVLYLQYYASLDYTPWQDAEMTMDNFNGSNYYPAGEKDDRMSAICAAAKANNVLIYTIGFEVSDANALKMQNCATTAAHFFRVDGVNIADAFAEIAAQLKSLRLVK